jgi:hypothetical protein
VVLTVNVSDDQIIVGRGAMPEGNGWLPVASLAHIVGKSFGWSWVGINHRGYADSFTLALGDVVPDALQPRLTFLSEASRLSCFEVAPVRR